MITSRRSAPDLPLRLLAVCTGNLCRSPTAEQLLRARLDPAGTTVRVSSAGTLAGDGDPMPEPAAAWSRQLGGDPSRHRSQYLTTKTLSSVDLVLGMARQHRRAVVDLRPAMVKVTFTLTEFARLAAETSDDALQAAIGSLSATATAGERLRTTLTVLTRARGVTPPPVGGFDDDVLDPIGGALRDFEQSARQIDAAVEQVVRVLRITLSETA